MSLYDEGFTEVQKRFDAWVAKLDEMLSPYTTGLRGMVAEHAKRLNLCPSCGDPQEEDGQTFPGVLITSGNGETWIEVCETCERYTEGEELGAYQDMVNSGWFIPDQGWPSFSQFLDALDEDEE